MLEGDFKLARFRQCFGLAQANGLMCGVEFRPVSRVKADTDKNQNRYAASHEEAL